MKKTVDDVVVAVVEEDAERYLSVGIEAQHNDDFDMTMKIGPLPDSFDLAAVDIAALLPIKQAVVEQWNEAVSDGISLEDFVDAAKATGGSVAVEYEHGPTVTLDYSDDA